MKYIDKEIIRTRYLILFNSLIVNSETYLKVKVFYKNELYFKVKPILNNQLNKHFLKI